MNLPEPFFSLAADRRPQIAIFLSGSGSNAERILRRWDAGGRAAFDVAALVTDCPEKSRAREIAGRFNLNLVANDIRVFHRQRSCKRITLATPEGRQLRGEWTNALRTQLAAYGIDFVLFAGFVPLTNLTADFPCLNVHPGDLTYLTDGTRHLVGLHTVPIERAILARLDYLRSSVIIAEPYEGGGNNMDSGPILGISTKVPIDFQGHELRALQAIADARPDKRPVGGFGDALEAVAAANQECLKQGGDWIVFPGVVFDFAAGKFAIDETKKLFYRDGEAWTPIATVEYGEDFVRIVPRAAGS